MKFFTILAAIEKLSAAAQVAIKPVDPGVAADINLGNTLLQVIEGLIPHAKAAAAGPTQS